MKKIIKILKRKTILRLAIFYFLVVIGISVGFLFVEGATNANVRNFFDAVWLSVISMTTTGYGDVVPVTVGGKIISIFTVFIGIVLMSLLTGTLASIYTNRISKKRSGYMKFKSMKDHLIICGWRENMGQFLISILLENAYPPEKIAIIADMPQEESEKIFNHEQLQDIRYVRGVGYDKNTLMKVNARYAKKAMVLPEYIKEGGIDVDSRSVMTVITLKTINEKMYVCAQLLDKEFDLYLKRANCDEIIYSKDINTRILSKTVCIEGMSNIMYSLLGGKNSDSMIKIEKIKQQYVNMSYKEFCNSYNAEHPSDLLLGILENAGQKNKIREKAIREAQKTANFIQMLYNLKQVKTLRPYKPVLLPDRNYTILENSSAIILGKKI